MHYQDFDRADQLYQDGMKVDPQNANLLVHRGLVALQGKGSFCFSRSFKNNFEKDPF